MSVEFLDSDRVNFLIWRYLRESNYNETALKLQKEWRIDGTDTHDPAVLPFSRHVKHHALITLLHKGLLSDALEREIQQEDGVFPSTFGVFGPLAVPSNAPSPVTAAAATAAADEDTLLDNAGLEISRKRPHEWQNHHHHQDQNESSAKRPRMSNGFNDDENAMDLDGDHELDDEHAYPSPAEVERPITPIITRGPEEGTQMDQVIELTGSTAFYSLTEDQISGAAANEAILLHCAWNPSDPTILATAGTDALARLWTFPHGASPTSQLHETPQHVNGNATPHQQRTTPPFVSLIKSTDDPSDLHVTAISWSPDGKALALAVDSRNDTTAKLLITSLDGSESQEFGALEATITCLRWNPQNYALLALLTDDEGSSINIFGPQADGSLGRTEVYRTVGELVGAEERHQQLLDAVWVNESEFVVCGEDILRSFKCVDDQVIPSNKYDTRDYHGFVRMIYDARSQLIATGSEGGTVDVWDMKGHKMSFSAHQGMVTALAWQSPVGQPLVSEESEILLASAGEDGIISIWNVRGPEKRPKRCMTMDSSVVALAFTPDGTFLTGATRNQILIWKIDELGLPSACWIRGTDHGWETPKSNGSDAMEYHHCLCWDGNGQRLAYGVANQLAIIDFNR